MREQIKKLHEDAYFIQLHQKGKIIYVRADYIVAIRENDAGTIISTPTNYDFVVDEDFETVDNLLFCANNASDELTFTDEANSNELSAHEILDEGIEFLDLSRRSFNCLRRHFGYVYKIDSPTIGDVCKLTPKEMKKIKCLGKKSYEEIVTKINYFGLTLRCEE